MTESSKENRVIADKKPEIIKLEAGTYYWCRCGKSAKQPFCDGSHKGTGISPEKFEPSEAKKVALCLCKQTGNEPFCDGTHADL